MKMWKRTRKEGPTKFQLTGNKRVNCGEAMVRILKLEMGNIVKELSHVRLAISNILIILRVLVRFIGFRYFYHGHRNLWLTVF